ncbi:hypothetical protein CLV78_1259 [Aliiruegeria haliotis]|uniref:Uncharacterized protein n=1 Tax=Aliiruegeria haliotis TaxID=1280846 RepID=A0A2T0RDR5_9RHOB|nr:hypothetical protein [Aliiruegeria haliotis]PRY19293.1 hypothetical protein CLV78_1259 [Aliiruegeria haliotis]
MQRVADGGRGSEKPPKGFYYLRDVFSKLYEEASPEFEPERSRRGNFSKPSLPGEEATTHWPTPDKEAVCRGIAFSILQRMIWPQSTDKGPLECRLWQDGSTVKLGEANDLDLEDLLWDCDPSPAPIIVDSKHDALSFAEADPLRRDFPFVDPKNWRVRESPRLDFARSKEEFEELLLIWDKVAPYAGGDMLLRRPEGYAGKGTLSLSQIVADHYKVIQDIACGVSPKKSSRLFAENVQRLAHTYMIFGERTKRPELSWIANELSRASSPSDRTNANSRPGVRDRIVRSYRDEVWKEVRALRNETVSLLELIQFIAGFPEHPPATTQLEQEIKIGTGFHNKWYRSQREHWLGWMAWQCYQQRLKGNDPSRVDAKGVWSRLKCSPLMFWLAECAGVEEDILNKATEQAKKAARINPKDGNPHGTLIREVLPWEVLADALERCADAKPFSKANADDDPAARDDVDLAARRLAEKLPAYQDAVSWMDLGIEPKP